MTLKQAINMLKDANSVDRIRVVEKDGTYWNRQHSVDFDFSDNEYFNQKVQSITIINDDSTYWLELAEIKVRGE